MPTMLYSSNLLITVNIVTRPTLLDNSTSGLVLSPDRILILHVPSKNLKARLNTAPIFRLVETFRIFVDLRLWFLADVYTEHHNLGRHRRHSVAEAILVHTVHVCSKRVFSIRLSFTRIDGFTVRPDNLHQKLNVRINYYH